MSILTESDRWDDFNFIMSIGRFYTLFHTVCFHSQHRKDACAFNAGTIYGFFVSISSN